MPLSINITLAQLIAAFIFGRLKMILLVLLLLASAVQGQQLPCGSTPISQSRVIGGQDAKPGAWPWQIALKRNGRFICGGSLISPKWVVTAAHCVAGSANPANYDIVVGDHNRNTNEGTEEQVKAKRIISHSQYNNPRLNNDIALIELLQAVKLNQRVNPVCIPSHDTDVPTGSKCYITGWGKIKHPGSSHHILQQAMMPPIDNIKCKQKIQASGVPITLTTKMLCAGVENTILSGCHGDSGGPYVCLNSDKKTYTLHGAVSWGSGSCNAKQLFTVFARVTQFRAWIKQHTGVGGGGGSPPPPPSPPLPTTPGNNVFECNFDNDLCGFKQSTSDVFDWTWQSGRTPSYNTGPTADVSNSGKYVFIETSSPRAQGDKAVLVKSGLVLPSKTCFSFYYHMYGASMGTLNVFLGQTKIFSLSGNQNNTWKKAEVIITEPGIKELKFEGIRGSSYTGDAAIDNVVLKDCSGGGGGGGGGGGCGSTVPPPATTAAPVVVAFDCNFDTSMCGFTQDINDKFDWTRQMGKTSSYDTGPSADHTTGTGYYVYTETSSPRLPNDKAKLHSPKLQFSGAMCLQFAYHMYGSGMGTLNVYVHGVKEFSKSGDQLNTWHEVKIDVNVSGGRYTVTFEGIRGNDFRSDIAIDDFLLAPGRCSSITPPPPTTTGPPPPPGSCGIRPPSRIVGGVNAKPGGWPWQVQLRTTSGFPYCGGSLVAVGNPSQWVVTAAHCVKNKSPSSIIVRAGAHHRTQSDSHVQDIKVIQVITHPEYHKPKQYSHDFALLKLEKPATLNSRVNLVCLPDAVNAPTDGDKCWITGWGRLASGGATPDYLQQVQVPVVSRARCEAAYPQKIHDSMICAGLDQGGIDSCQGDSGGPMVCETGGRYYLQGATSWGYGCASPGKFGVYAKVKYLMNWLKNVTASTMVS